MSPAAQDLPQDAETLPQILVRRASETPKGVALRQKAFGIWQTISWADYDREARAVAHGLLAQGLKPESHVAILSDNRKEWVIAQMGIGMARAITTGVYPTSPAAEVGYVIAHAECDFVLCEDQEQADKLLEIKNQLNRIKRVIVIDMKGLKADADPWLMSYEALVELGVEDRRAHPDVIEDNLARQSLDDVALLVYTSGSTGKPKGALITWRNLATTAKSAGAVSGAEPGDSCLSYLPLCHVAEQLFSVCLGVGMGVTINFGESLRTIQRDLVEIAPTIFFGVPRIWEKMQSTILVKLEEAGRPRKRLFDRAFRACRPFCDKPRANRTIAERLTFSIYYWLIFRALQNVLGLRHARFLASSAAPISPEVLTFFRTLGLPVREAFGMTESAALGFVQDANDFRPGMVGPPYPGVAYKIAPDGELLLQGLMVFNGYYRDPEATAETLQDGWLHTGDLAEADDGQVRIVGRKKEIIITAGGKNLAPAELENNLKASPYIKEAVVIGDRRAYLTALIQIDFDNVSVWAERQGLAVTGFKSLAEDKAVRRLIEAEVDAANERVARVAQVKKFSLLSKELDHDDDELTATQKIRRTQIHEKYAEAIAALY